MFNRSVMSIFLALLSVSTTMAVDELPYSLDILDFTYSDDAGRRIVYDFTGGEVFEPYRIILPESAILAIAPGEEFTEFLWEGMYTNIGWTELQIPLGRCGLYLPHWHYPEDDDEIYDFVSLGAHNAAQTTPMNWDFTARVSNIRNLGGEGHPAFRRYRWKMGIGSSDVRVDCYATAEWFTGWFNGSYYEHVLVLTAQVYDEPNGQEWESWQTNPIFLEDLNPIETEVELKVQIRNGTEFSAFYRLNDDVNWQTIWEDFDAPAAIPGFPAMSPHLRIKNGLSRHHIPKFENEELARLAKWWRADNCNWEINYACWGMDIDQNGVVDLSDIAIFVDNWLTRL